MLPLSLELLFDTITLHFVGSSHTQIKLVKSCKLVYICKYVVTIWPIWMKFNQIRYKI
jgi:hypothetical protein